MENRIFKKICHNLSEMDFWMTLKNLNFCKIIINKTCLKASKIIMMRFKIIMNLKISKIIQII